MASSYPGFGYPHFTSSPATSRLFYFWGSPGSGAGGLELLKGLVVRAQRLGRWRWVRLCHTSGFPLQGSTGQIEVHCSGNSEGGERTRARVSVSPRVVQG